MAKIKFGMMMTDARGKIGGQVFSKNRGGAYVRTKVTPSNPQTSYQSGVRGALTSFAQGWRDLTEAQRLSWNGAVNNFTGTDVFADVKIPSGINLYTKLNLNLENAGQAPINTAPLPGSTGYFTSASITAAAGVPTLDIAYVASGLAAGQTVIVEATAPMSPGIYSAKNRFRKIGTFAGGAASPFDALADYTTKFGSLVAGQKIMVRMKPIDNATGVAGQYIVAEAIIAV